MLLIDGTGVKVSVSVVWLALALVGCWRRVVVVTLLDRLLFIDHEVGRVVRCRVVAGWALGWSGYGWVMASWRVWAR